MSGKPQLLIVEDAPSMARLYQQYLSTISVEIVFAETLKAGREFLGDLAPTVMLLDLGLPDGDGMDLLRQVNDESIPTTVVVATAQGSLNVAVEAMRIGAYDFIVKPAAPDRLRTTIQNALERQSLQEIAEEVRAVNRDGFVSFVGRSPIMQAVYKVVESAAASNATVFITGASGTGKELCAEAIHKLSDRAQKPFVALNCGAIPANLMESEIFGHKKGAFTGATADRTGAASRANGGTLFLDEIGELPLDLQTKLLRFLQTGVYQRVGDDREERSDIRIVCATNRDPYEEVQAGRFREDLYYRLHVIPVHMPPLKDREGDVIAIADTFLSRFAKEEGKTFAGFSDAVRRRFLTYSWPGNVRELQNIIRNVVVLNDGSQVEEAMLPPPLDRDVSEQQVSATGLQPIPLSPSQSAAPEIASIRPLWEVERNAIEEAIQLCDGNITKAASLLELAPSTIYRKRLTWTAR